MSDDPNQDILRELRQINEKLDRLQADKGLSSPMKIFAAFVGFAVLGPVIAGLLVFLLR